MTTEFEKKVYNQLYASSIIFLKDGIERLVNKDNGDIDVIDNDLLSLTCTSFQISIELAIKALIIERSGLKNVIEKKYHLLSEEEIELKFLNNELKSLEFEMQKNFVKKNQFIQDLTKNDYKIIDSFQKYRNRIVHFTYNFDDADLNALKHDMIYYMIQIIFKILLSKKHQDERPSEFLEYTLGRGLHKQLISYRPYVSAMEKLAKANSPVVLNCIICFNRTLSQYEEYCYCCNFLTEGFTLIDCDYCKVKKSVIYDNLNIALNDNTARGECLNCGNDGIIFECPECGKAHNIETNFDNEKCSNEECLNKSAVLELPTN